MPTYDNKNAGIVTITKGKNPRQLFKHQEVAMFKLNEIDKKKDFSAIIVLPTGAGKTLTSVYWLLKNAINKRKRVLWIAHRHLLLDQAAEAFVNNGYSDLLPDRISYKYRIISGIHDKPIHIKGDEDIIIAGKDSIIKNLQAIGDWMSDEDVYLVIDEAHHAVARTYQKIIMAYHADPSIPKTIEEWLDQFEMFSIYQVLPQILELWGENLMTDVQAKKGLAGVSGK